MIDTIGLLELEQFQNSEPANLIRKKFRGMCLSCVNWYLAKKKKISCALGAQKFKGYQAGSQAVHTSGRLVSVLGNFQNEEPVIGFFGVAS